MRYDRCPNCMQSLTQEGDKCPYCGFDITNYKERQTCLKPFTVLQNKYMLGRVIGVGGFGITYLGWDMNLQTYIAIKEYYPEGFVTRNTQGDNASTEVVPKETNIEDYNKGLKRYVEEAQNLSKFYTLPGIVSVKDFFYDNSTAYIVMEYINGINLKEYLNNSGGKLPEATVLSLMKPVFESLYTVHNGGLVHRDISPDNIMVTSDGKIKVIDFGAARENTGTSDKTMTVILKHGYAPPEQYYAKGHQGPWTDIYSLCAAMYKMLTGQVPPNSIERMDQDEYVAPSAYGISVSQRTELVLQKGLAVRTGDRYQNIGQLIADLYGSQPITPLQQQTPNTNNANAVGNSVSQRSMYIPEAAIATKKKGLSGGAITGIVAGTVVLFLIVLFYIIGRNSHDDKTTESQNPTTTEATTEDISATTTEDPNVEPDGYAWEWPEELSNDWRDYTFAIGDDNYEVVYKLPMPISEFVNVGWELDDPTLLVPSGNFDGCTASYGNLTATIAVYNFSARACNLEDCILVGIDFDNSYYSIPEDMHITFANGIQVGVSSLQDIKTAWGAPDSVSSNEDEEDPLTYVDYSGEDWRDGVDITLRGDVIDEIMLANTQIPEGAEFDYSSISTAPPEMNALYQAPTSGSTDRFDSIITVAGTNYRLPVPVAEFTANGWIISGDVEEYMYGYETTTAYLEKDGERISVDLENFTPNAIFTINACVTCIEVEDTSAIEVIFPGGIKVGDPESVIENMYSDMETGYSKEEYDSWGNSYYIYAHLNDDYVTDVYIYASINKDTGLIEKYSYQDYRELDEL